MQDFCNTRSDCHMEKTGITETHFDCPNSKDDNALSIEGYSII